MVSGWFGCGRRSSTLCHGVWHASVSVSVRRELDRLMTLTLSCSGVGCAVSCSNPSALRLYAYRVSEPLSADTDPGTGRRCLGRLVSLSVMAVWLLSVCARETERDLYVKYVHLAEQCLIV
jgi:hypothetical protein